MLTALERAVPGGVAARATDRLGFAHDASHYLLVPQAVVTPRSTQEVAALLRTATEQGVPLTFRSGGTSLSGQASGNGVLVDTRRSFRDLEVLDDGARVRVQPGVTVRAVNARLARYGRRLGPDPASEIACTIGGVVANNSSGMACGTDLNSYRTLESAVLVLPSGTVIDTAAPDADERLRTLEPAIHAGLVLLRDRIRGNPESVRTLERLFAIKNTMGYGLNAFLDHNRPVDLLTRLVVGSEGTLAFVAEATFRTVPLQAHAATALLVLPSLAAATRCLPEVVAAGFATVELLDATSLQIAQVDPLALPALRTLSIEGHAALLVEHQEPDIESLAARVAEGSALLDELPLAVPAALRSDPAERAALWHIRKGLFTAVAGARPTGTTALLEDIAVPVPELFATCAGLTELFGRHGYEGSAVFGHAKDGNVHFLLNEAFDDPRLVDRYVAFTEDMVELVLGSGGTLKAEHGTGRIMAPFLRRQYGDELVDVMHDLKALIDPHGVLNPGVLLNDDPQSHLLHLKTTPTVEPEVDRCVECGYCEPVCPSKDLTTTPRRRIVLRREIVRARQLGDEALAAQLEREYDYDAVQTCAVDGMCQTACPVLIDTGDLTRRLRGEDAGALTQRGWAAAAKRWGPTTRAAAAGLTAAKALPPAVAVRTTQVARAAFGADAVPAWSPDLPRGGRPRPARASGSAEAVFFPSCTSAMFGPARAEDEGTGVSDALLALCDRADVSVRVPESIDGLCCGTPWKSKGLTEGWQRMRAQVLPALQEATEDWRLPVVVDAASCTEGLVRLLAGSGARVLDAVAFADDRLLARLPAIRRLPSLTLHPTCASVQLGLDGALGRVGAAVADEVVTPLDAGCCAFAGDRGLLHPELTASATARETAEVRTHGTSAYASVNRTCELGMSRASGQPYEHVLEVLERRSRPY